MNRYNSSWLAAAELSIKGQLIAFIDTDYMDIIIWTQAF